MPALLYTAAMLLTGAAVAGAQQRQVGRWVGAGLGAALLSLSLLLATQRLGSTPLMPQHAPQHAAVAAQAAEAGTVPDDRGAADEPAQCPPALFDQIAADLAPFNDSGIELTMVEQVGGGAGGPAVGAHAAAAAAGELSLRWNPPAGWVWCAHTPRLLGMTGGTLSSLALLRQRQRRSPVEWAPLARAGELSVPAAAPEPGGAVAAPAVARCSSSLPASVWAWVRRAVSAPASHSAGRLSAASDRLLTACQPRAAGHGLSLAFSFLCLCVSAPCTLQRRRD